MTKKPKKRQMNLAQKRGKNWGNPTAGKTVRDAKQKPGGGGVGKKRSSKKGEAEKKMPRRGGTPAKRTRYDGVREKKSKPKRLNKARTKNMTPHIRRN